MADEIRPASEPDKTPPPRTPRSEARLQPGELLGGNFEILSKLGEGGMAVVYRCLQRSLNRQVALKVLHSRFARDHEFIERFEAESGALASLTHPNIVGIIDRGHDGERYYFVMELVDGETLDRKILGDKLTQNDWRKIITSCRDALDYVHRRGVVHRDIKPSNILLDEDGRVKIGDFGIAHIIGGDAGEAAQVTAPTRAVGTANYMAPEQTAHPASVDSRADVYSLAVTFYKMFTKSLPIGDFLAPSEANSAVPVAVDAVIYKALCPDRDDRYQTVAEFCEVLLKALKEQTVSITSMLNYRQSSSATALYTGKDFRTPSPEEVEKAAGGKTPSKTVRKPDFITPLPIKRTPSSESTVKVAPMANSPRPIKPKGPSIVDNQKAMGRLAIGAVIVAILLVLVAIVIWWQSTRPVRHGGEIPPPITDARSKLFEGKQPGS